MSDHTLSALELFFWVLWFLVFNSSNEQQVHVKVFDPVGRKQLAVVSGVLMDMEYISKLARTNRILGLTIIVKPVSSTKTLYWIRMYAWKLFEILYFKN